jgi:hypothetical protein
MRNLSSRFGYALAAIVAFAGGCEKKSVTTPAVTPAPVTVPAGLPISEDEGSAFGKKLEAAILAGDKATAGRLIRLEELAERSVSDLNLSAPLRSGFLSGFNSGGRDQLTNQLSDIVQKGGKYTFLRVRTVDNRLRVLMRLILPIGGVNYHDITLTRFADGPVGAEDIHVMASGEMLSQTFRRLLLQIMAEKDQGLLAKLTGAEQVYTAHLPKVQSMMLAVQQGRNQEALRIYHQLPAVLQKDKEFQLTAIRAAQSDRNAEYLELLESFRQNNPNDPASDLMSLDYFLLKKQYDKALDCLGRMEKAVGGDPYLLVFRANALVAAGRYADARAEAEKAVQQEAHLVPAYWARIMVALKEKNHPDTLAWLKKIVEECGMRINEAYIKTNADYAAFAKSPQFVEFQKWYKARTK